MFLKHMRSMALEIGGSVGRATKGTRMARPDDATGRRRMKREERFMMVL